MEFRGLTGGFDLLSIEASDASSIKFRAVERISPPDQPTTVKRFTIGLIPAGAVFDDVLLDAQSRQRVIGGAIAILQEFYVYPDIARKMADALGEHLKSGDYDSVTAGDDFADLLTRHLEAVSHDKHLQVNYRPIKYPAGLPEPSAAYRKAEMTKQMQRINCDRKEKQCQTILDAALRSWCQVARQTCLRADVQEYVLGSGGLHLQFEESKTCHGRRRNNRWGRSSR
jgi:hypothetical protein